VKRLFLLPHWKFSVIKPSILLLLNLLAYCAFTLPYRSPKQSKKTEDTYAIFFYLTQIDPLFQSVAVKLHKIFQCRFYAKEKMTQCSDSFLEAA
jgi:hypothetical protein